jgi:hypothetical protein
MFNRRIFMHGGDPFLQPGNPLAGMVIDRKWDV